MKKIRGTTVTFRRKVKKAAELYEEALDEGCECHQPGGVCPHCSRIEIARSILEKIIGKYNQL